MTSLFDNNDAHTTLTPMVSRLFHDDDSKSSIKFVNDRETLRNTINKQISEVCFNITVITLVFNII